MGILEKLGFRFELVSREEAAMTLLERDVSFKWRPQIVEESWERCSETKAQGSSEKSPNPSRHTDSTPGGAE